MNTRLYGGKTKIIPMNLCDFVNFITIAKDTKFSDSSNLRSYLDGLINQNLVIEYEDDWFSVVKNSTYYWTNQLK
jgi:hypothetical protein